MASVSFTVEHRFDASPTRVWNELVDWEGHGAWIPMTRMKVSDGEPTEPGFEFTAWTGLGPLALEDRMQVTRCEWESEVERGECEVAKLGPVLRGRAGFAIEPDGSGAVVEWIEDVTVPLVPQFLAPVVARLGAFGFKRAMTSLEKCLSAHGN